MNLRKLKPNPQNPRLISGAAFEQLKKSISRDPKFMELRPIVVDKDNIILGGNQRYRAARALGMQEVPDSWVKTAEELSDDERRRFIIIDNAPEGMAGAWDFEKLANEWDFDELVGVGFKFPPQDEEKEEKQKEEANKMFDLSFFSVLLLLSKRTFKDWKDKKGELSDDEFMRQILGSDGVKDA